jgi:hypothetical protein
MFVTSTRLKFRALAAIFQSGAARNMMLIMTSSKKTRLLGRDALSKRTTSQSGRRQHVSNISCFVLDRDYALAQWDSINILHLETNSLAELITVSSNISQPLLLQWNISDAAFLLLHLSDHLLPHNLFLRDLFLLWDLLPEPPNSYSMIR